MKLKKKGLFAPLFLSLLLAGCSSTASNEATTVNVIDNVEKYSRISTNELITLVGEPVSIETWNTGKADVETYTYDINKNHYEYVIADDSVVRLTIYSDKYWNNGDNEFAYAKENDIPAMFDIKITDKTKGGKNGTTFVLSPVNDKIANVQFGDVSNNTFGYAKVTYNVNYFE